MHTHRYIPYTLPSLATMFGPTHACGERCCLVLLTHRLVIAPLVRRAAPRPLPVLSYSRSTRRSFNSDFEIFFPAHEMALQINPLCSDWIESVFVEGKKRKARNGEDSGSAESAESVKSAKSVKSVKAATAARGEGGRRVRRGGARGRRRMHKFLKTRRGSDGDGDGEGGRGGDGGGSGGGGSGGDGDGGGSDITTLSTKATVAEKELEDASGEAGSHLTSPNVPEGRDLVELFPGDDEKGGEEDTHGSSINSDNGNDNNHGEDDEERGGPGAEEPPFGFWVRRRLTTEAGVSGDGIGEPLLRCTGNICHGKDGT